MRASILVLVVAFGGCEASHESEPDAGITFMAPDVGPPEADAGPPTIGDSVVGTPCVTDDDCMDEGAPACLDDPDFSPAGYCTNYCVVGDDSCPDGSVCTQVNETTALCFVSCDPAAPACREGYGCAELAPSGPVCVGGCEENDDCGGSLACAADGGFWGEGSCYDPDANLGDSCNFSEECPADSFCLNERFTGWPGGACAAFGCAAGSDTGCPDGAHCVTDVFFGEAACIMGCETDTDCRDGYACVADSLYPDRLTCQGRCTADSQCTADGRVCNEALGRCDRVFDPMQLGTPCMSRRSCRGGSCIGESTSGWPGTYCAYIGCTTGVPDAEDGCPGDGVCLDGADGLGVCVDPCASDGTCSRPGYACQAASTSDGATACLPGCTDDSVCSGGRTCDTDTGRCT
jgi:hypothetical protein